MASTTTGNNYFTKSMNSIIEIDDGAGTVISDGSINCNSFNTSNFSTSNFNSSSGTITNLNSTIGNITTINSNNIISNFATINNIGSTIGNITTINSNNIISNFATINNLHSTTGNFTTINSNTINLQNISGNNVVSNFATINKLTCPIGNVTTVNATDLNSTYSTILESTVQTLTLRKDFNNPSNTISLFFNSDASQTYYELNGTSQLNFTINGNNALIMKENDSTFNNTIISPTTKTSSIQPITTTSNFDLLTTSTGNITLGPTNNKIILGNNAVGLTGTINLNGDVNVSGVLKNKSVNTTVFKTWTSTFTSTGTLNYQVIIVSLPETVSYSGDGFLLNAYNANYASNTQFFVLGCTPSLANNTPAGSFSRVRLWCYITQPLTVHTVNISCCYIPV